MSKKDRFEVIYQETDKINISVYLLSTGLFVIIM